LRFIVALTVWTFSDSADSETFFHLRWKWAADTTGTALAVSLYFLEL